MRFINTIVAVACPLILFSSCQDRYYASGLDLDQSSWPIVTDDAVYILSGLNGALVRVEPGPQGEDLEADAYTNLEEATIQTIYVGNGPQTLVATPDQGRLLVLSHERNEHLLAIVDPEAQCTGEWPLDLGCVTPLEARPLHDQLVLSSDGRYALSYISPESASNSTEDVINLNEVGVYDLQALSVRFASLGFNPKGFAFTHDDSADQRVVAITSTKVIALNLVTGESIPRELTLGTETQQTPSQVLITGDDRFAFVTIEDSADLYTFDLTQSTLPINILSLSDAPSKMALSASGTETLVLTSSHRELNLIHHGDLSVDVYSLLDRADEILVPPGASYAALYDSSGSGRYLHYVDPEAGRVQAYLLQNPCKNVLASPGGDALVLYFTPDDRDDGDPILDASYAVAILNISQGDRQPNPILVNSVPVGAAFREGAEPAFDQVFVALDDDGDSALIARLNLSTYDNATVVVPPSPRALGVLDDGRVVVVHASPLGLISVFPAQQPDLVQFISGFMGKELL